MTSKAIVKCDSKWKYLALGVLAMTLWQAAPAAVFLCGFPATT